MKVWAVVGVLLATVLASLPSVGSPGHAQAVYALAFSPDGRALASGSSDGTAKIWNPASGMLHRTLLQAGGVSPEQIIYLLR